MTPAHLRALQAIYAAALDPDLWQAAMDAMAAVSGGVRTHLLHADATNTHAERSLVSGYDPDHLASWDAYYQSINAWAPGMLAMPVGEPWLCEWMCGYDDLRRTEFYADWVQPAGDIIGGGAVVIERGPGRLTLLGGNIPRSQRERLDDGWQRDLALFGPAVRHALATNAALLGLRLEAILAREGEFGDAAVLLLDDGGRVLLANAAGARALEAGTAARVGADLRLSLRDDLLDHLLRRSLRRGAPPVLRRVPGRPEAVRLMPLAEAASAALRLPPLPAGRRAALAVVIATATEPNAPDLAARLGLSAAEADLALRLARGMTPAEVAEARGTSVHTVRNQLKSALAKTGCRRQADLVVLVERLGR